MSRPSSPPSSFSQARYVREVDLSLARAWTIFSEQWTARALFGALAGLTAVRLWVGGFSHWDLVALAAAWALQPFVEWVIHVFVLHAKPFEVAGVRVDLDPAIHHRAHHRDPWDLRFTIMPASAVYGGAPLLAVLWLVAMPTLGSALTGMWISTVLALGYEWVHYLIHTSYRPRSRLFLHLWRMHRFHHFKNERYWMGVSRTFADRVLGTAPDPKSVPSSKTARNLEGDRVLADD